MAKRARVRSRLNTNTSNASSRVENVKDSLLTIGFGQKLVENDAGVSRASSEMSEQAEIDDVEGDLSSVNVYSNIFRQLVISRLMLFAVQSLGGVLPDAPTDAFKGIESADFSSSTVLRTLFSGLTCWDARHFLHIASYGYTWESTMAFFPMFPFTLRFFGHIINLVLYNSSLYSCMVIGGVFLNNTLFVINGILLYQLCLKLTHSEKESIIAVYVYCYNPSSIFFSAIYTESLYLTFSLLGLLSLFNPTKTEQNYQKYLSAAACFALGYLTRANGWLNLGYIGYVLMVEVLTKHGIDGLEWESRRNWIWKSMKALPILIICTIIVILPLRSFGWLLEDRFCKSTTIYYTESEQNLHIPPFHDEVSDRILPGDLPNLKWCTKNNLLPIFPSYYSHVQQKYWNVGVFMYWQLKKIPMFLMATPTIIIMVYGVMDSVLDVALDKRNGAGIIADVKYLFPFALHNLFLGLAGIFFYNVEVVTRILFSSGPFLYIAIARIMSSHCPRIHIPTDLMEPPVFPFFTNYWHIRTSSKLLLYYLFGYCFLGAVAHVNWLPFV